MTQSDETRRETWDGVLAGEGTCDRFERAYLAGLDRGGRPRIEDHLGGQAEPARSQRLLKLLSIELDYRSQAGESPVPEEYLARFPDDASIVRAAFAVLAELPAAELLRDGERWGGYTIRGLLGQGGMGAVYRAWHEGWQQEVALKVIRADRLAGASPAVRQRWVARFLEEAQAATRVQHAAIVPLLDYGQVEELPYLAMSLIEGRNLREWQRREPVSVTRTVEIVLAIAEALDCLHQQGIYHCDVKPSNILIDHAGRPYLSDFGLALDEARIPAEPGLMGTAAYMSPEQACGEGHLLDGRSDIFSLTVVLYELLGGENPFEQVDREKTLELVRHARVAPLRRKHLEIPEELDRICQRGLARRAADRYPTARDLAGDLRAWLAEHADAEPVEAAADGALPRIDLKGILAFGPEDGPAYLRLAPGPYTRSGLPVSIAAWLAGIETTVPVRAFRAGLLYGPSGAGKSSLVRAGILPRLSDRVAAVYVDGSRDVETELRQQLLVRLATRDTPALAALIASARRGRAEPGDTTPAKLLIVIDHFEHWLQAHPQVADAELTAALRQCDGVGVQCLLLVREEFRTPAARFLKELELEGPPALRESLLDLFDIEHARRVLTAMGRSAQTLPATDEELSAEHRRFLDVAVQLLEHQGRVVPAQLAMFVDYMRDKPWTAESLSALGGPDSLAAAFLDDLLRRAVASPRPQRALDTVAGVLQALLPRAEAEYRRTPRTEEELFAAVRPRRREQVQPILDALCATRVLSLVHPPDIAPSNRDAESAHVAASGPDANSGLGETTLREFRYQLAHDSLLPLVRAWLHVKQRDRWWGRHVQRMTEHAVTWSRRPRAALLPSLSDWAVQGVADAVQRLRPGTLAPPPAQRRMMRAATAYYLRAAGLLTLLVAMIAGPLAWLLDRHHRLTEWTVAEILHADPERLPDLVPTEARESSAVQRRLVQELEAAVPDDASELAQDAAAERRANAGAGLCLADPQNGVQVWPWLTDVPDPRLRTALIHHLAQAAVEPSILIRGYQDQRDPGVRQALLLALGRFPEGRVPETLQAALVPKLQADYRTDPDSGVHAAIDWLLRRWGRGKELRELNRQLEQAGWDPAHNWYHTPSGHLMIVIRGPVEFEMGSSETERGHEPDEVRQRVRIERSFAISATEVTELQFWTCWDEPYAPRDQDRPDDHYPMQRNINWIDAAGYCHRLTMLDGLDAAGTQYPSILEVLLTATPHRIDYDAVRAWCAPAALSRSGYRLPTEEEWEYACRAGATTSRFFGETELYLDSYGWSYDTSKEEAQPVGQLMPNRLGLFDIMGNLAEWCHAVYRRSDEDFAMSIRGGSVWSSPVKLRASHRSSFPFAHTDPRMGFRIARTLPSPSPRPQSGPRD